MKTAIQAQVDRELLAIPRGSLAQNLYRAAYEQARLSGLGNRSEMAADPSSAREVALHTVRTYYPDFTPNLR